MKPRKEKFEYVLPEGFMNKYQDEIRKLNRMSDVMKAMYLRVGREQYDKLARSMNKLTNEKIHHV